MSETKDATGRPPGLPDFENPPLGEVVLALQYSLPKELLAPHIGLYWQLIRNSFPQVEHHPPAGGPKEDLTEGKLPVPGMSMQFVQGLPPMPRCWFLDADGSRLIQFQPGHFIHNWRRLTREDEYPHFENLRDEFIARWQQLVGFFEQQDLGSPSVEQAELTYVNYVPQGSCWGNMDDISEVFPMLPDTRGLDHVPPLESFRCAVHFRLPEGHGRLHVAVSPVAQPREGELAAALRANLTVRGPVADSTKEAILRWFGASRERIVSVFTELTTRKAHEYWKRIS